MVLRVLTTSLWWTLTSIDAWSSQYFHKFQCALFHCIFSFRWKQTHHGRNLQSPDQRGGQRVIDGKMSNNSTPTTRIPTSLPAPQVLPTLPHGEVEIIFATIVYVLLALFVILGNILVIAAFRFNSRLRTINNTFLVGLAVSDLLVGLISIPLWIYFRIANSIWHASIVKNYWRFIQPWTYSPVAPPFCSLQPSASNAIWR